MVEPSDSLEYMESIRKPKSPPRAPRVIVQLSPETRKTLDRLAALTGAPKSSLIADVVDQALPALVNAVEVMELVKSGQKLQAERLINHFAHQASAELAQQQLELHAHIDGRTVEGQREKRRAARGRPTP